MRNSSRRIFEVWGGVTDVVQHAHTGLLVPPSDVVALAAALDTLIDHPAMAIELGQAGRRYALSTFAPETVARRYAEIYRDAIRHRAA